MILFYSIAVQVLLTTDFFVILSNTTQDIGYSKETIILLGEKLKNDIWSLYTWQVSRYMLNCKNITHSKRIFMCPFFSTYAVFFSHVTKTVTTIYKYMHNQIAIDLAMPSFDVPCLNLIYKAVLHYFKLSMICDSWIFKSNLHLPFLHACLLVICLICPLFCVYLQIV